MIKMVSRRVQRRGILFQGEWYAHPKVLELRGKRVSVMRTTDEEKRLVVFRNRWPVCVAGLRKRLSPEQRGLIGRNLQGLSAPGHWQIDAHQMYAGKWEIVIYDVGERQVKMIKTLDESPFDYDYALAFVDAVHLYGIPRIVDALSGTSGFRCFVQSYDVFVLTPPVTPHRGVKAIERILFDRRRNDREVPV